MMLSNNLVEVGGTIPPARFGPTATQVAPQRIMIFAGATGNSGNYSFTNDTYTFEIQKRLWKKITSKPTSTQQMEQSLVQEQHMLLWPSMLIK